MARSRPIAQQSFTGRLSLLLPSFFLTLLLLGVSVNAQKPAARAADAADTLDIAAARSLFEKNLQAIRDKNKDAYLSCYLDSAGLARTGSTGFELGYAGLAKNAGQGWPDHFSAEDLRLTPIRPGVIYGTYRYRVRYGAREDAGLSERVFLKTEKGWKIAVSTAFSNLPGVPPPPRALVGATLVDGNGEAPVPDSVVLLREGKIECAGARAACPVPAGDRDGRLAGAVDHPRARRRPRPLLPDRLGGRPARRSGRPERAPLREGRGGPEEPPRALRPHLPLLGGHRGLRRRRLSLDPGAREALRGEHSRSLTSPPPDRSSRPSTTGSTSRPSGSSSI